ncbi:MULTISPECIES: flagellar FlbD family protein [Bacillales]|jgi:flagellar protein FlbD|uniref:Flagellar protein FlbD n=1 Tax=Brevibacillus aydinogluensis TaxID=927786 RepID=A0AA48RHC0_9BACL|nr:MULTISPECIES: flagellar FlbD family protein [Bacillales]REK64206.1 MAG: hypothetical protein DF221_08885 [Brevibacillus sp.]MBR8659488.1 flagellar FlbD family protein [Brevibacillus sp. NL20B1]MDT3415018.1 flagellar protein FlbD [Brevibacillus aydinogluensis]NNV01809.1 hypothetical protein [Brevibacillus sp. MCWH]UFJ60827.1 flagellar FlbD family protein [Anoxybacillus sediminis]
MIRLTRFNGEEFYLNATHVEMVESTPDTVITLFNGKKYIVRESAEAVASRIVDFYRQTFPASAAPRVPDDFIE